MIIFVTMLGMGMLVGFVGAGGAGVTIAVLTLVFHIPAHTAVGTSLAAMIFTTISGAFSHFREQNIHLKIGVTVGLSGFVGAFIGAKIATTFLSGSHLKLCTAVMLILSALLIFSRITWPHLPIFQPRGAVSEIKGPKFWTLAILAGLGNGLLSGTFGFGASQFIQVTLLILFNLSLFQSVGTTMLIVLPIAVSGGLGYLLSGHLEMMLFIQVLSGMMIGAYLGAKLTRLAPQWLLTSAMVFMPGVAGVLMIVLNR